MSATAREPFARAAGPLPRAWLNLPGMTALFGLTVRRLLRGKRLLSVVALFLLPTLIVLLRRWTGESQSPTGAEMVGLLELFTPSLVPFAALLFATGLVQDEVEEQTLTYLLVRPIPRSMVVLIKLTAAALTTALLATAALAVNLAVIYHGSEPGPQPNFATRWLALSAINALAAAAYIGLFGFVGLLFRRPLPFGAFYIIMIEGLFSTIPFVIRDYTVSFHARVLMLRWLDLPAQAKERWAFQDGLLPSTAECVTWLLAVAAVLGLVAAVTFTLREFRMKTPEAT